ncbi:hypothetical protein TREMEDRAFT_60679 [Tremella mesenterica DSM 1558]|uniref:uncharacterized protein n=1 Tax=Tremella mesenterica (strain ATCC 24925 / CBS 8224 / DSM 1558 / NBRC 9311 / NRRL Y-6157 / RJB 2259-6 / UBC 559-6) TaxID=578456 RepID=UPI0003F49E7F|nr:uncharacterized protein TREMEDRAFT_60679 [Tremella mesenterica DSM 1558]EIW71765.1 hypothetical protein TREMEDRAFT_60679 [Tremella mesenterica DSM 1558]
MTVLHEVCFELTVSWVYNRMLWTWTALTISTLSVPVIIPAQTEGQWFSANQEMTHATSRHQAPTGPPSQQAGKSRDWMPAGPVPSTNFGNRTHEVLSTDGKKNGTGSPEEVEVLTDIEPNDHGDGNDDAIFETVHDFLCSWVNRDSTPRGVIKVLWSLTRKPTNLTRPTDPRSGDVAMITAFGSRAYQSPSPMPTKGFDEVA